MSSTGASADCMRTRSNTGCPEVDVVLVVDAAGANVAVRRTAPRNGRLRALIQEVDSPGSRIRGRHVLLNQSRNALAPWVVLPPESDISSSYKPRPLRASSCSASLREESDGASATCCSEWSASRHAFVWFSSSDVGRRVLEVPGLMPGAGGHLPTDFELLADQGLNRFQDRGR